MGAPPDLALIDRVVRQLRGLYWIVDRDLRVTNTGGAIEDVLGYFSGRHLGRTLVEIHAEEPGTPDPIAIHRRALAGETVAFDSEYRNKLLRIVVAPLRDGDEIVGVVGTAIDETVSRGFERRVVDTQRVESLGVLAGGLAHDFNNLLVAILGNADLALRELRAGTAERQLIENIRSAALRAAELTTQLLAYAGPAASPAPVALAPLVAELLRIAPPRSSATSVVVELGADLVVHGDASQLRQVMLNLIANARDALDARGGTIAITGRAVDHDGVAEPDDVVAAPAGRYVAIDVTDDGPGIDAELRHRIFDPFFTTKATGHGLGLASVLGIVRAHRGGLRLTSGRGRGAHFRVLLPAEPEPEVAAAPTPGRTVLVIDDEDLVRDVVARMVEDLGYTAITAPDGHAGMAVIDQRAVDLVLVDMSMPRMSGADVVTALRARRPELPIVLVSGYDRTRGQAGAPAPDAYLAKPFRLDALEQTLAKLLGN